ncbi:tetratricopeptide repeat protein [Nicoliella spurrieriana]|uniref:Tetratricopeptide repeat protein n=1 Tax=Nicoliella spurrieriana TaxID=2925830 RepID=A0A976RRB3_9LACO|nr:tetratricopeptide repeat protein [Nicoliella spurrieriana]UQS86450.1 tetratricopeptide repeat protein [Nicoliella spurrieriana]
MSDKQTGNQEHQEQVAKQREAKQKKADETLHKLVQDIDDHPHDYRTYYDLGTFLVQLRNYNQAEELLMKAMGLFADRSKKAKNTLIYGLGNVYYAAGEYDKAIQQFNQIDDQKLKFDSYIMVAQSYMSKKNYKRAVVFALTAQGMRRQDPSVNWILGSSLLALGNFSEAAQFFDIMLQNDTNNGKANFDRGIIAMVLGEPFDDYFAKAKKYDRAYFDKGQSRLKDIEKFIQIQKGKRD